MSRRTAESELRAWVQSRYFIQLENSEVDQLLAELVAREYASPPKVVATIVSRLFPNRVTQEKEMSNRVVPPLSSRAAAPAPPPPPQTPQELEEIMRQYINTNHFQTVAPNSAQPWAFREGVMYVGSRTNLALLKAKLKEMGVQRIRVSDIQEAVFALANAGVFERVPTVRVVETPKPVEVAPEPTERELYNRQVRVDRAMNDRDSHPVRGAREKAQPLIKSIDNSNIIETAKSEEAARSNAIVNEALSRIDAFRGHSHSRTAGGKAAMRAVFQAAMDAGRPAEEVLAAVEAEASRLAGDSSIR